MDVCIEKYTISVNKGEPYFDVKFSKEDGYNSWVNGYINSILQKTELMI